MIKHRQFFKDQVVFKNLLEIDNQQILNKIHMNHRLTYLRDTAIGRFIEENTIKNINILIHYNNSDLVQYFLSNENLLKNLIEKINNDDFGIRSQGIQFLLELISCSKDIVKMKNIFNQFIFFLKLIFRYKQEYISLKNYVN